jgi:hypothetical protein
MMQNKGYSPEFLDRVRNASNIVDIARNYLPLRQKGQDFWACCPFHSEKTPSFAISSPKQFYYCYGCHKSGDVITLVMELESLDFSDTVKYLAEKAKGSSILIPKTFDVKNVCIRPNTLSAGSKGLQLLDNVSITQKINIVEEYVVDVLRDDDNIRIFPRQVKLKNGYDRLIMPISENSLLADDIVEFITKVSPSNEGVFSDIFHLQLAKADDGNVYYIEWSKRISGTSVVNLFRGMNPFCFINGIDVKVENPFSYGEWYRYEDFLNQISCL